MTFSDSVQTRIRHLAARRITIGVTGFSRSGKTVFIGAVAQALLTAGYWDQRRGQGPLARFGPFERGKIRGASIRDDIYSCLPHFPFHKVRDSLLGRTAHWPEPTTGISRIVLDIDTVASPGVKQRLARKVGLPNVGLGHIQLELVDYPGEWLVDLSMLGQSYEAWSEHMLLLASEEPRTALSGQYLSELAALAIQQHFDAEIIERLADLWEDYLRRAAALGLTLNQPGRLLRPDTLRHSPVLQLVPLPPEYSESKLYRGMRRRFSEYKAKVIKPFHSEHFARMDRQIVLVDVLRTLEAGQQVFDEMVRSMAMALGAFRYGKGGWLSKLPGVARTTHVLFAATKADHVTRHDRANLEELLRLILGSLDENARMRADAGRHEVLALASVRATTDYQTEGQPRREILRGRPAGASDEGLWDPGNLPLDMPPEWSDLSFQFFNFDPPSMPKAQVEGFPAINLGKALDFLVGEDFK